MAVVFTLLSDMLLVDMSLAVMVPVVISESLIELAWMVLCVTSVFDTRLSDTSTSDNVEADIVLSVKAVFVTLESCMVAVEMSVAVIVPSVKLVSSMALDDNVELFIAVDSMVLSFISVEVMLLESMMTVCNDESVIAVEVISPFEKTLSDKFELDMVALVTTISDKFDSEISELFMVTVVKTLPVMVPSLIFVSEMSLFLNEL